MTWALEGSKALEVLGIGGGLASGLAGGIFAGLIIITYKGGEQQIGHPFFIGSKVT